MWRGARSKPAKSKHLCNCFRIELRSVEHFISYRPGACKLKRLHHHSVPSDKNGWMMNGYCPGLHEPDKKKEIRGPTGGPRSYCHRPITLPPWTYKSLHVQHRVPCTCTLIVNSLTLRCDGVFFFYISKPPAEPGG